MRGIRRRVQYFMALVGNLYWLFPWKAPIYQGPLKRICFPGLNCYSCPAATTACPLGGLQNFFANLRPTLHAGQIHLGVYVVGSLGVVGSIIGRAPCGWFCPFGLIQELLHGVPVKKFGLPGGLHLIRFAVLALLVVILPLFVVDSLGYGQTWFCKYLCPAGTLEAGLPLLFLENGLRRLVGPLFFNKIFLLTLILVACFFVSRFFCRVLCPLGAIFGLFNGFSWFRLRFRPDHCVECKACLKVCPTQIQFYDMSEDINSSKCIRCLKCYNVCPAGAICLETGMIKEEAGSVYCAKEEK